MRIYKGDKSLDIS